MAARWTLQQKKLNRWRYHMSAFKINEKQLDLLGRTSEFLCSLFVLDWHVRCEQRWGQRSKKDAFLIGSFSLSFTQSNSGSFLNVIITQSEPLPLRWGPLSLLPSFSPFPNRLCLCLIQHDSISPPSTSPSLPLFSISVPKMSTRGTTKLPSNTRSMRDTVIKLNGLNMSLGGIFIKAIHQGRPTVTQLGDLSTNISDYRVDFQTSICNTSYIPIKAHGLLWYACSNSIKTYGKDRKAYFNISLWFSFEIHGHAQSCFSGLDVMCCCRCLVIILSDTNNAPEIRDIYDSSCITLFASQTTSYFPRYFQSLSPRCNIFRKKLGSQCMIFIMVAEKMSLILHRSKIRLELLELSVDHDSASCHTAWDLWFLLRFKEGRADWSSQRKKKI